ncbi:LTA synthase family protein [Mycoplasmatota bacterium]|nr:LTA synthase family protein [Mycoplasmatota bacterium]
MKRLVIEKLCLMTIFIVFYLIIEMVTFRWLRFGFLPDVFFVDIFIALIISSMALLFKSHRISVIYLSSLIFLFLLISFTNQTMNLELNGEIFTLSHFHFLGEATHVFLIEFIHIDTLLVLISIGLMYGLTVYIVKKLFFQTYLYHKHYYKQALTLFVSIILAFTMIVNTGLSGFKDFGRISNINLFKRETIEAYGLIGFYYKDVDIMFFNQGNHISDREELDSQLEYHSLNDYADADLDIPYTNLFRDKNVITIMVESGQSFAINEFLTPNLYDLTNQGLYFPNHYSENKTNVSEIIGILGSYPSEGILINQYQYDFRYSLPKMLSERGYQTAYFHENLGSFYHRENIIPSLGFDEVYMHEELFPDEDIYGWGGDYTLDSRTMDRMFDFMFTKDQPFYYFWSSLVSHGPYNSNYPSDRGDNNMKKFRDLGYFSLIDLAESRGDWVNLMADSEDERDPGRFRFYQATMMDFDVALGKLMDKLEEKNLIDDTIILLYGDHNLYYHQMHLRLNGVEEGEIHYPDMYKTMFMIYNPILTNAYVSNHQTTSTRVEKFVSPYDIVPTFYQLLGIPHYKNFVLGQSVFSEESSVFYSHKISSFFNQEFFSYNNYSIFYPEDILVNEDLDALNFIEKTRKFSEDLVWLDQWVALMKNKK